MKVRRVRARAVYHGRFRKVNDRAPAFAFVTRGGLRYGAEMPTADRKLVVAVLGVGWCASQHIAAFLFNRHTAVTWLCARDADRAREILAKYRVTLPNAWITTSYDD